MGRMANVEATDWSWGALIFDMDNDGLRDLFVANGIYQDITDLDYLNFIDNEETKVKIITQEGVDYKALIDPIPVNPVPNYAFKNLGDLQFENKAQEWGLGEAIHSNGSAYGDLDNDGTLDLVINNVNKPAQIFKNLSKTLLPENHSIQFELIGKGMNTQAIGTQILAIAGDQKFYLEQMPNRGFQSSVDPKLTLGLGKITKLDQIYITWPDGKVSLLENQSADKLLQLKWEDAQAGIEVPSSKGIKPLFSKEEQPLIDFQHQENTFVDFDRDRLLYHMFSTEGPAFAKADVNGDGIEDLYFGGSKGFSAKLYLGSSSGKYSLSRQAAFEADSTAEDS
nr:hypothetical protein [Algoriphagus sp.]